MDAELTTVIVKTSAIILQRVISIQKIQLFLCINILNFVEVLVTKMGYPMEDHAVSKTCVKNSLFSAITNHSDRLIFYITFQEFTNTNWPGCNLFSNKG